jgi:hypothetical protein
MRNKALADALYRTDSGKQVAFQAKRSIAIDRRRQETERKSKEIAIRIRQLKELVYATFVAQVPANCRTPRAVLYSIYQDAKPVIRDLGIKGGEDYSKVMAAVKFAWSSDEACREAVGLITSK